MFSDITSVITFLAKLPISEGNLLNNNLSFKAVSTVLEYEATYLSKLPLNKD